MSSKLNTEFNYRYQVIWETIWEKIKTLKGFYEGRLRARGLEQVSDLKLRSKKEKIKWIREWNWPEWEALELEGEVLEWEQSKEIHNDLHDLNEEEIKILEKLLKEAYEIGEPTRIEWYTDEQMFEANAVNEFTAQIWKDIYSEMIASWRPSAAKIRNAMSNPITWNTLKIAGLIPKENNLLICSDNPLDSTLLLLNTETKW